MSEIDNDRFCEAARKARTRDSDVIASSPTIPANGTTLAHRIVIRDQGDQIVVHMQVFEANGQCSFSHGNYYPVNISDETNGENRRKAIRKAWEQFERRSRRTLGLEDDLHDYRSAADVAEEIIKAVLPDDDEERIDIIEDDYMLKSNLETFEHLTGKTLWAIACGISNEDEEDE